MKSKKVKHQLKGLIHLDTINLELKLLNTEPLDLLDDTIFIDLSQCRFAELNALTKLLLIIERYLKNQHSIFLALPTVQYTEGERASNNFSTNQDLKEKTLTRRQNANNFLKKSGFVSAVQDIASKYQSNIYITEEYEFEKQGFNEESFKNAFSVIFDSYLISDLGYKFLLPFRWIDCESDLHEINDFAELEDKINRILGNQERGLDNIDVKGIRNVILSELIKNVREHSKSKYAIFTIGLISSEALFHTDKYKKQNPLENEYLQWISENEIKSQVELYFGDSGIGILNKDYENYVKTSKSESSVSKKHQIEFAFSKWSTLKNDELRRGTKGLYRLLRIVNKYNGLVHIDTSKSNGGFSKNTLVYRSSHYDFQGTLINIKLNPFKEIKLVKYSLDSNSNVKKWSSKKYILNHELSCLELIKYDIRHSQNLLVILDANDMDFAIERDQKALEEVLYEISFESHPTTVVIYLLSKSGNVTTSTIIESVQIRILESLGSNIIPEIKDENYEEIHDPVFVLGSNNEAFWYGGSNELITILRESYISGSGIYDLNSYKDLSEEKQSQIILHLKSYDSDLIRLNNKNEIIFNFRDIEKHYEETIVKALSESQKELRCTPKLYIVDRWIEVRKMLEQNEFGFALCLYIIYITELDKQGGKIEDLDKENTFILIDHNLQGELAHRFADLLGIKMKNIRNIESDIDPSIPKRTKLFPKNANVIFLTTMISSSETVRRLVKYARRDYANPQVILCLGNFRNFNINHLETWSETTQILSCFKQNGEDGPKEIRDDKYFEDKYEALKNLEVIINPDLTSEVFKIKSENSLIQVDEELIKFLKNNKMLHYNHFGFYNKRHFTFFLDKVKILNTDSFLWNRIKESFSMWLNLKGITNYTIYVSESILGENSVFLTMLKSFSKNNVIVLDHNIQYINSPNSIYFDFGILTGETINDFLAKCTRVENLYVCLLFNQAVNSNKDLYKKINTFKYTDLDGTIKLTNFDIEYLYHLPLSFFTSENCPICEHRRALDFFKMDHEYLFKFSEDRQERLKQNSVNDIHEVDYPVDFYYSSESYEQELSSNIIVQMYEFKILLENAKKSTTSRIEVYNLIFQLWKNLIDEIPNAESKIYSLLYYLSHEINWFQQEPLIFRDLRMLVSEIALGVALEPINHLINCFDKSNSFNVNSRSLAIRYKYSAISILRSTDKLVFCQSIYKIILSSVNDGICSNNLLQNTLYHISSFYKNTYNKSELYYIEIASNLAKALSDDIGLLDEKRSAINVLITENSKARKGITSIREEPAKFKEMKERWERIYRLQMPAHPAPFVEFKELALSKYDIFFDDWKNGKLSDDSISTISGRIRHIYDSWNTLKSYVESNIIYYFKNSLYKLNESSFFKDHYDVFLNVNNYENNVKKGDSLIKTIQDNWEDYLVNREEYNSILEHFQISYIQMNGLSDFQNDSKILQLLADFPANITAAVNEVFPVENFENRQFFLQYRGELLTPSDEQYSAYFPMSQLRIYLRLILENLSKRLNKGKVLNDVNLRFLISIDEKNALQLKIIYNLTNQCQDDRNPKGSLSAFEILLKEFGGELKYITPTQGSDDFILIIKFLRYE